ncbi:MAG: sialidase family protein [Planctomycetota bacterium]
MPSKPLQNAEHPERPFADYSPQQCRRHELDVLRQVADLALLPPRLNTSPLPDYDYDRLHYGMTLGIERTPAGRLWVAWVAGEDGPRAFTLAATSDDDGRTWSKPRLVIQGNEAPLPLPRSVIIGNFWTDPRGRLWLFFDQTMNHFDGRSGLWATCCNNPDDAQPTWTTPRRIWHGSMLNKPIVLDDGRWLLAVQLLQSSGFYPLVGLFPELDPWRGVNLLVSDDDGDSFHRVGHVKIPNPDWHEPMVVQRRDGSLWMLVRTKKGIVETTSTDGATTWTTPAPLDGVVHPSARFNLRRLLSGRLLLVKHGDRLDTIPETHRGRSMLSAWLSDDDGKTWTGGLVLDGRAVVTYPDSTQALDGTLYITYDLNRSPEGKIVMARISEEDIDAGHLVTDGSVLRQCIIEPLGG